MKTQKENNIVTQLCENIQLPKMIKVRQRFNNEHIATEDIYGIVKAELEREVIKSQIKPDMKVAITCGSRGISNIALIIKAIVDYVKEAGAYPFVFPAMGSHGGATADGQLEILKGFGVTEEFLGCPIHATMETIQIGESCEGIPAFIDKFAYEADAIILCGRIKAHTCFRGEFESGLLKMAAIGMGKQHGAEYIHELGFENMSRILPQVGKIILEKSNIICGVGLIENATEQTCIIKALTSEEILTEEPKLLLTAKEKMGRLFFPETDVLIVDRIGKNISGDGMDPNVTGTFGSPAVESGGIKAQRVIVLDLTDETHGNGNGIGTADITTMRLVNKLDLDMTYPNALTATLLLSANIPVCTHSDKTAIQLGIKSCCGIDKKNPCIIRIKDTMHLENIYISEALLKEAEKNPDIEILSGAEDWNFDEEGNLW